MDHLADRIGASFTDFGAFALARLEAKSVWFLVARTPIFSDRHYAEVDRFKGWSGARRARKLDQLADFGALAVA